MSGNQARFSGHLFVTFILQNNVENSKVSYEHKHVISFVSYTGLKLLSNPKTLLFGGGVLNGFKMPRITER